jgi:hypothetical protein
MARQRVVARTPRRPPGRRRPSTRQDALLFTLLTTRGQGEIVVADVSEFYVTEIVLDKWLIVVTDAVRRLLATLLDVEEEEIELEPTELQKWYKLEPVAKGTCGRAPPSLWLARRLSPRRDADAARIFHISETANPGQRRRGELSYSGTADKARPPHPPWLINPSHLLRRRRRNS